MKIKEVFQKDPSRTFERVIKIDELSPEVLGQDLDEYVVTDEIRNYIRDILDEFLQSRRGEPEWVCAWISGYFGSGKTHFLKAMAALLGNLEVKLPGEEGIIRTLDYFPEKWGLSAYSEILKKEFIVKPVVINLLYPKTHEAPPLSQLIYIEFMASYGYSRVPWVAEMERQLKQDGLLGKFKQKVEEIEGKSWEELRESPLYTRKVMAEALTKIDSRRWPTLDLALKSLDDQKDFEKRINPMWLAQRLKEEAEALDPIKGRIVLLLDEVGLYVGDNHDRLMELQAIAETISQKHMRGKVWLIVTSQEALEEKIAEIGRREAQFQKLRDRFRMKATLTPENVTTVVQKRLLEKKLESPVFNYLKDKFSSCSGQLAAGAMLKDVSRDIERYTKLPPFEEFYAFYPFMPYHLHLTQKILERLRGKGYGAQGLTGRERTALGIVQGVLSHGEPPFLEIEIGHLATFDKIFDAIEQEVQALRGEEIAMIKSLAKLEEKENLPIQKVAKSLFLLQQVGEWIPTTAENIAAVLYPRLGEEPHSLLEDVRKSLALLEKEKWVEGREGKYRFLSQSERNFAEEIERYKSRIPTIDKQKLARNILREKLRAFHKLRYRDLQDFEIKIELDDDHIVSPKGHVLLKVFSPLYPPESSLEDLETKSAREKDIIYLITPSDPALEEEITELLALERVISERKKKALSEDEKKFIREKERELAELQEDVLPTKILDLLKRSTLIYRGNTRQIEGANWESQIRQALTECISSVFYEFDKGATKVREEDIDKVLSGNYMIQACKDLEIVDNSGNIREDSPLLSTVLAEIRKRVEKYDPKRTGGDLEASFAAPPYGWDSKVVRLALASLLVRGSISLNYGGKIYTYPSSELSEIFKSKQKFSQATFDLGIILTPEEEKKAADLLGELFSVYNATTPAEIWERLKEKLEEVKGKGRSLLQRLEDLNLGGRRSLKELIDKCEEILQSGINEMPALKIFTKDETAELLRRTLKIYYKLAEIEKEQKFGKAVQIKKFADKLHVLDPKSSEELKRALLDETFPLKWEDIFGLYHEKRDFYIQEYKKRHLKMFRFTKNTLEEIKKHKAFEEKEDEAKEILQRNPIPFKCSIETPELDTESLSCSECRISLEELNELQEKIERWKDKVLKELETLLIPPEDKIFEEEKIEIKTIEEFEAIKRKIRVYVERILEKGKRARLYYIISEE